MQFAILVNDHHAVELKQTTLKMIEVAAERGHTVWVMGVGDLSCTQDGRVRAQAQKLSQSHYASLKSLLNELSQTPAQAVDLGSCDVLLLRTNPARDKIHSPWHTTALALARMVRDQGVTVLNDPDGLIRASSKLYLQELPAAVRPLTLVSANRDEIIHFISTFDGPGVLKPLQGTRGTDVFMVQSAADKNLLQIIDVLLRQGLAMVQNFIPEAVQGDTRVIVVEGEILRVDGHPAAFRRIPIGTDFRSNVDVGGKTAQAVMTSEMEDVVAQVGPYLRRDGLFMVGLDFIGNKIVEVNAFSPGGLRAARKYEEVDFTAALFQHIEGRVKT